jgi:hypothetical protein
VVRCSAALLATSGLAADARPSRRGLTSSRSLSEGKHKTVSSHTGAHLTGVRFLMSSAVRRSSEPDTDVKREDPLVHVTEVEGVKAVFDEQLAIE